MNFFCCLILVSPGVLKAVVFLKYVIKKSILSVTDLMNSLSHWHAIDSRSICTFDGVYRSQNVEAFRLSNTQCF